MKTLGIEVDESMIGNGIYERAAQWYSWRLTRKHLSSVREPVSPGIERSTPSGDWRG